MFVIGTCPSNGTQLKITEYPGTHLAGLAEERNKARSGLRVNPAGWSEETGAITSTEEV
jgi:hypothetical protein